MTELKWYVFIAKDKESCKERIPGCPQKGGRTKMKIMKERLHRNRQKSKNLKQDSKRQKRKQKYLTET